MRAISAAVARVLAEFRESTGHEFVRLPANRRWGLTAVDQVWISHGALAAVLTRPGLVDVGKERSRVDGRFEMVILVQPGALPSAGVPGSWGHYMFSNMGEAVPMVKLSRPHFMAAVDNGPLITVLGRDALADVAKGAEISISMFDTRDQIAAKLLAADGYASVVRRHALTAVTAPQYTIWVGN